MSLAPTDTEIADIDRLFAATLADAPELAFLQRRIAKTYGALEAMRAPPPPQGPSNGTPGAALRIAA